MYLKLLEWLFSLTKEQWTNRDDYNCILNILCIFLFFYITGVIVNLHWDGLDQCLKIDTCALLNL